MIVRVDRPVHPAEPRHVHGYPGKSPTAYCITEPNNNIRPVHTLQQWECSPVDYCLIQMVSSHSAHWSRCRRRVGKKWKSNFMPVLCL